MFCCFHHFKSSAAKRGVGRQRILKSSRTQTDAQTDGRTKVRSRVQWIERRWKFTCLLTAYMQILDDIRDWIQCAFCGFFPIENEPHCIQIDSNGKKEILLTVFCSIDVAHCRSIPDSRCQIRCSSTGSLGKDQFVFFLILTFWIKILADLTLNHCNLERGRTIRVRERHAIVLRCF